jgi:hypothetical protein
LKDHSDNISKSTTALLRRIARISSVVLIGLTLFVLVGFLTTPDPYAVDYDPIENILPLTMSLSVFALAIAWRWEGIGSALSLALFILVIILDWIIRGSFFPLRGLLIFLPLPATALLFLVCWFRSRSA